MKQVISTEKAPAAIGPYSQAIEVNGMVYTSGQIPVNPATGEIAGTIEGQARQVMENVKNLLAAAGAFFQLFPIFFPNVHITIAENGTIMITFSMHSVVSFCSPFTVSQMPQPPMTSDKGFIHS